MPSCLQILGPPASASPGVSGVCLVTWLTATPLGPPPSWGPRLTHGAPCRAVISASSGWGGCWIPSLQTQSPGQAECPSTPGWLEGALLGVYRGKQESKHRLSCSPRPPAVTQAQAQMVDPQGSRPLGEHLHTTGQSPWSHCRDRDWVTARQRGPAGALH